MCGDLYSKEKKGNDPQQSIFLGRARNNELTFATSAYYFQVLKRWNHFPKSFLSALKYIEKKRHLGDGSIKKFLKKYISKTPKYENSIDYDDIYENELTFKQAWNDAFRHTVLSKLQKKYPNSINPQYGKIEERRDYKKTRVNFMREYFKVLWGNDKRWLTLQGKVKNIQKIYISFIESSGVLSSLEKEDWIDKINELKFQFPGQNIDLQGSGDLEKGTKCGMSTLNAAYDSVHHVIYFCAGLLTSIAAEFTIAHEMGHALGMQREIFLYQQANSFVQQFQKIRSLLKQKNREQIVCEEYDNMLSKYKYSSLFNRKYSFSSQKFYNEIIGFQSPPGNRLFQMNSVLENISENSKYHLKQNIYFYLFPSNGLDISGKPSENNFYKNPFPYESNLNQKYFHYSYISQMILTLEMRCNKTKEEISLDFVNRSIELALNIQSEYTKNFLTEVFNFSNHFDDHYFLEKNFSFNEEERVADLFAAKVYAQSLRSISPDKRMSSFFKNTAFIVCTEPSGVESAHPYIYEIYKNFSTDRHSTSSSRLLEILTPEIKDLLKCD